MPAYQITQEFMRKVTREKIGLLAFLGNKNKVFVNLQPKRHWISERKQLYKFRYGIVMTSLWLWVRFYAAAALTMLVFAVLKLLYFLPCSRFIIIRLFKKIATIELPQDVYKNSLFTWSMFKVHTDMIRRELQKTVRLGQSAPNPLLLNLDGKARCNLLDLVQDGRPLVVIFGSCTCPVFMNRIPEICAIMDDFGDVADFSFVYVQEAHPSDGWAFNGNYDIREHRTQEERCAAAQFFSEKLDRPCTVLVDTIDNEAANAFSAPPNRLCIIQKENVEYLGGIGPTFFRPYEVRQWLEELTENSLKGGRHRA